AIAAVRDRIVQAALKIVLEPVFEADFADCSFGFRPKRSAHDALQVLVDEAWRGRRWVVETDIANCFSAIPHDKLMQAVEERISDRPVLALVRAMLRAGVLEDGRGGREGPGCAGAAHNRVGATGPGTQGGQDPDRAPHRGEEHRGLWFPRLSPPVGAGPGHGRVPPGVFPGG